MTFPWKQLALVTTSLTALTSAVCAAVAPEQTATVAAIVAAGVPVVVGTVWTAAVAYVAVVGPDQSRVDEVLEALREQLEKLSEQ